MKERRKSRVPDQNDVSLLYIMLKIHHSGQEPSKSEYSDKIPDDELQKMPHTKIQAPAETQTHILALVAG